MDDELKTLWDEYLEEGGLLEWNELSHLIDSARLAFEAGYNALKKSLDDADLRAGRAERRAQYLLNEKVARAYWIIDAIDEAGYPAGVSFDVVWRETLAKAKLYDEEHKDG